MVASSLEILTLVLVVVAISNVEVEIVLDSSYILYMYIHSSRIAVIVIQLGYLISLYV